MKKQRKYLPLLLTAMFMVGCTEVTETEVAKEDVVVESSVQETTSEVGTETVSEATSESKDNSTTSQTSTSQTSTNVNNTQTTATVKQDQFAGYKMIEVNACNLSGSRAANVVVNIGAGDRSYFAFTNEFGQLIRVIADEIILQDDNKEPVTSSGRYCSDEAKVPGVESATLDEGHVIADSLGGCFKRL